MRNTTTSTPHVASPLASAIGSALREARASAPARVALVVAALAVGAADVQAQSVWTNPGTGDWFDAGNWSAGVPDNDAGVAEINNGGTAQVEDGVAEQAWTILGVDGDGSGTLMVLGGGVVNTGRLVVGDLGTGRLEIRDGGRATAIQPQFGFNHGYGAIAYGIGSEGSALVDGAGSTWDLGAGFLQVGRGGSGRLDIRNGGQVLVETMEVGGDTRHDGHGVVNIDGIGSSLTVDGLTLGKNDQSSGSVFINNGGSLTSRHGSIGRFSNGHDFVIVQGVGSSWSSGSIDVGRSSGRAELIIRHGGRVTTASGLTLGRGANGSGFLLVDGAGSMLDSQGWLTIGLGGAGFMTVRNGATVNSATGVIAESAIDGGEVLIEGAGSSWNIESELVVGDENEGSLVIRDGGVVNSGSGLIGNNCRESTPLVCGSGHGSVLVAGNDSAWNITGGALQIGSAFYSFRGGLSGDGELTIADGGRVSVSGDEGVLLGDFSVGGSVSGAGILNIGGGADEAATGAGILDAAFVEGRGSDAILNFNHVDGDYWFTRDGTSEGGWVAVTGTARVNHLGPGRTVLGDATYSGDTTVEAGTLLIGGDSVLGGHVSVFDGATFGGTATVGSIDNAGTVSAGIDGIGTLTLTGDYVHRSGAFLWIDLDGPDSDRLDVAGTATLEGGTVMVGEVQGQISGGTRYTILQADGGVDGVFDMLVDGLPSEERPFIDLLFGYDANHVYLDVVRTGVAFSDVCVGFNACAVAGGLDRSVAGGAILPDDFESVLLELTTLDEAEAGFAFDTLSGEVHASLANLVLESRALAGRAIGRRLDGRRVGDGARQAAGWFRAYGTNAELDSDGAAGADYEVRGFAAGFDTWVNDAWLLGAAIDVAKLDADFDPRGDLAGDSAEADTRDVSLYASFDGTRTYLDAIASYGWSSNDVTRHIAVGDIVRTARADYDGNHLGAYVEGGLVFGSDRHRVRPFLSLQYDKVEQDAFAETGAGDVSLLGRGHDVERTTAGLGLAWSTSFGSGRWTVEPTVDVRWLHAFGDLDAEFDVAFTGAPDSGYRVRGLAVPANRGALGLGLVARSGGNLDLFVDYDYQQGDDLESHELGAGVRLRW